MKLMAYSLAVLILVSGTNSFAQEVRSEASEFADCTVPEGWQDVADRKPLYVVFGELHGTQEGPEFFGNLACALASRGERILLAIEHSALHNAAMQAAWNMPADRFEAALTETGWTGRNDGVASEAMFAMLVRAHDLKERGYPLSVVAFNGIRNDDQARRFADLPGQGPHEAAQAENIAGAASSDEYDRVLVLVGSLHARKDRVERGGVTFEPMVRHLARTGKTISLEMRYGTGKSWNCVLKPGFEPVSGQSVSSEMIECGSHATPGNADMDRAPHIAFAPSSATGPAGEFDGFFWVGPINGSRPFRATR